MLLCVVCRLLIGVLVVVCCLWLFVVCWCSLFVVCCWLFLLSCVLMVDRFCLLVVVCGGLCLVCVFFVVWLLVPMLFRSWCALFVVSCCVVRCCLLVV